MFVYFKSWLTRSWKLWWWWWPGSQYCVQPWWPHILSGQVLGVDGGCSWFSGLIWPTVSGSVADLDFWEISGRESSTDCCLPQTSFETAANSSKFDLGHWNCMNYVCFTRFRPHWYVVAPLGEKANVFGPNNRSRRILLLVFLRLKNQPHINEAW